MEVRTLRSKTSTAVIGSTILYFDEIDSTSTHAKQLAMEGAADGTVVIADFQTAGRGRMGRSFQSPKGKGLYLSILLRPDVPAEQMTAITALAGIAVCDAVEAVCGVRPGLKWPNDPVMGRKKVCGILTEAVTDPNGKTAVVLGIGINVLQTEADFPPELRSLATSVFAETGCSVSREELTKILLERLEQAYDVLKTGEWSDWTEAYRKGCVHLGRQIRLIGPTSEETAVALDVDKAFGLIVAGEDGMIWTVRTGEISVRGLFGYAE